MGKGLFMYSELALTSIRSEGDLLFEEFFAFSEWMVGASVSVVTRLPHGEHRKGYSRTFTPDP